MSTNREDGSENHWHDEPCKSTALPDEIEVENILGEGKSKPSENGIFHRIIDGVETISGFINDSHDKTFGNFLDCPNHNQTGKSSIMNICDVLLNCGVHIQFREKEPNVI